MSTSVGASRRSPESQQISGTSNSADLIDELNLALDRIRDGNIDAAIGRLAAELRSHCRKAADWKAVLLPLCRAHPIRAVLLEDPYTRRANDKPNGYAGDAAMMDFLYFQRPPGGTSQLGRKIFAHTTGCSNGESVRHRRQVLADFIDDAAARTDAAEVLAVACGHLREAALSTALRSNRLRRLVAYDHDSSSLEEVGRCYGQYGVETRLGTVKCIGQSISVDSFDLIYAAGIYDYLPQPLATKLTELLFAKLKPKGTLLIANFLPENHGAGYMEAFMDWFLTCRDSLDIQQLARRIPDTAKVRESVFVDPYGNVAYLELVRA